MDPTLCADVAAITRRRLASGSCPIRPAPAPQARTRDPAAGCVSERFVGWHARAFVALWTPAVVLSFAAAAGVVGDGLAPPRLHNGDIEAPGESRDG